MAIVNIFLLVAIYFILTVAVAIKEEGYKRVYLNMDESKILKSNTFKHDKM